MSPAGPSRRQFSVNDEAQRRAAEASRAAAQEAPGETIVTAIEDGGPFYPVEGIAKTMTRRIGCGIA